MFTRAVLATFTLVLLITPWGCSYGERSLTLEGPRREAKLAVSAEEKEDKVDRVIIYED
jgi:hypothetical protein